MKSLTIPVLAAALLVVAPGAPAQTSGESTAITRAPGAVRAMHATKTTVTVTGVNPANRTISMQRPDGTIVDVHAGPEVKNFDKIKVGDKVKAEYTQALALDLKKGPPGTARRIESPPSVSRTQGGAEPAATVGATVTVLADVVAVNQKDDSVTLRGPEGRLVDLKVPDPEQLKRIKKGDQVQAVYTEALALKLEPAEPAAGK